MRSQNVSFFSDGDRVDALLRTPEDRDGPVPGIVHGPGFGSTKDSGLYDRIHESLARAGYAALVFDYRGYGESEGARRLRPVRQVEDFRNAVTALAGRTEVDGSRIGAFGHGGTGGGNAVTVAALDDRIGAVVSSLGVADGGAWLRTVRREYEWRAFRRRVAADVERRVETGDGESVQLIGGVLPATPERDERLGTPPTTQVPLADVRELIAYRPVDVVERIAPAGSLFVCVEDDDVTPAGQSRALYEAAAGPKKLVTLTGTTHYAASEDRFDDIVDHTIKWFDRHLAATDQRVRETPASDG